MSYPRSIARLRVFFFIFQFKNTWSMHGIHFLSQLKDSILKESIISPPNKRKEIRLKLTREDWIYHVTSLHNNIQVIFMSRRSVSILNSIIRSLRTSITGNSGGVPLAIHRPSVVNMKDIKTKTATFAMSWFWFPEAQFGCADGVVQTKVGYTGGIKPNPTYHSL